MVMCVCVLDFSDTTSLLFTVAMFMVKLQAVLYTKCVRKRMISSTPHLNLTTTYDSLVVYFKPQNNKMLTSAPFFLFFNKQKKS